MQSKPMVALILPVDTYKLMFREKDLESLRNYAEISGPFMLDGLKADNPVLKEAVVAITGWGSPTFDEALLNLMPKMRLLAHSAGSVKTFVSDAFFERGLRVIGAAAANAVPVAQFTVAMINTMLRQIPWIPMAMAAGDQQELAERKKFIRELHDMTVGLVGASRVGREVVGLLKPYVNIHILVYDPYLSDAQARELGVEKASLDEVCRCEVVSIHAPKSPETYHMFNSRTLGLLPDHAVLINTARGALVDEVALLAEVRRRPLYVCLDVTDPEPVPLDSPLRKEKNILLTTHVAGALNQACRDMGKLAIDETIRFLRGEKLQHEVTRQMLAIQA